MNEELKYAIVRGPVALYVDGQELGGEPIEAPTTLGSISLSVTLEFPPAPNCRCVVPAPGATVARTWTLEELEAELCEGIDPT